MPLHSESSWDDHSEGVTELKQLILDLVDCVNGRKPSDALAPVVQVLGEMRTRALCSHLLGWVLDRALGITDGKLELDLGKPFPRQIVQIIRTDPEFSSIFVVSEDTVDYAPSMSGAERREIEAYVSGHLDDGFTFSIYPTAP